MLPQSVTDSFVELGIVGVSREDYNVVKYGRDGLYVHVLRLQEGKKDTWRGGGEKRQLCLYDKSGLSDAARSARRRPGSQRGRNDWSALGQL